MKLLDRLAIHSLIKTITEFILKLVSLLTTNNKKDDNNPYPPNDTDKRKGILSKLKTIINKIKKKEV